MSERTTACEAPSIRMTTDSAAVRATKGKHMKPWTEITHYAGFDWARDHHDVVIVDRQGQIVADLRFPHSLAGWQQFREQVKAYPSLAIAIETSQGAAVDQLLQTDGQVYPVNPLSAKSYRERKVPSGNKTDRLDAWSLAEALRLDGQHWKALQPLDPLTQQIQLLCRDEIALIEQRTALINQLQQALCEYYPAALQAFEDWTRPSCWDFVIQFSTPAKLTTATAALGKVPARPQPLASRNPRPTAGELPKRPEVLRHGRGDLRQKFAGHQSGEATQGPPTPIGSIPRTNRGPLPTTSRS